MVNIVNVLNFVGQMIIKFENVEFGFKVFEIFVVNF